MILLCFSPCKWRCFLGAELHFVTVKDFSAKAEVFLTTILLMAVLFDFLRVNEGVSIANGDITLRDTFSLCKRKCF